MTNRRESPRPNGSGILVRAGLIRPVLRSCIGDSSVNCLKGNLGGLSTGLTPTSPPSIRCAKKVAVDLASKAVGYVCMHTMTFFRASKALSRPHFPQERRKKGGCSIFVIIAATSLTERRRCGTLSNEPISDWSEPPHGVVDKARRLLSCRHCRMQHGISATAAQESSAARTGRTHRQHREQVSCRGMLPSLQILVTMAATWWCLGGLPGAFQSIRLPYLSFSPSLSPHPPFLVSFSLRACAWVRAR